MNRYDTLVANIYNVLNGQSVATSQEDVFNLQIRKKKLAKGIKKELKALDAPLMHNSIVDYVIYNSKSQSQDEKLIRIEYKRGDILFAIRSVLKLYHIGVA